MANNEDKIGMLARFGYQIASERRLKQLIELLAEQARQLVEADRCSVFIVDHDSEEVWSRVAQGMEKAELRFSMSKGLVGYVARTGNTLNIPDAYQNEYFNPESDIQSGYHTKTILSSAMKNSKGEVLGVFQAINKKSGVFTAEDEGFLNLLGSIGAAAIENSMLYENIRKIEYETISRLANATQLRDKVDLAGHLRRMSEYSRLIAEEMKLPIDTIEAIHMGSLLHDIGKIGVPDDILKAHRKLTDEEFVIMREHTVYGATILDNSDIELLQIARNIAGCHHEKFDGTGYPNKLKGEDIPLEARIVAMADVFDALTSKRVYKPGWSVDETLKFIREQSGKQFDPVVVEAFFACFPKIQSFLEQFQHEEANQ